MNLYGPAAAAKMRFRIHVWIWAARNGVKMVKTAMKFKASEIRDVKKRNIRIDWEE
jgi:hypothetical protein